MNDPRLIGDCSIAEIPGSKLSRDKYGLWSWKKIYKGQATDLPLWQILYGSSLPGFPLMTALLPDITFEDGGLVTIEIEYVGQYYSINNFSTVEGSLKRTVSTCAAFQEFSYTWAALTTDLLGYPAYFYHNQTDNGPVFGVTVEQLSPTTTYYYCTQTIPTGPRFTQGQATLGWVLERTGFPPSFPVFSLTHQPVPGLPTSSKVVLDTNPTGFINNQGLIGTGLAGQPLWFFEDLDYVQYGGWYRVAEKWAYVYYDLLTG